MKKTIVYLPLFILISITGVNSQQKGKQSILKNVKTLNATLSLSFQSINEWVFIIIHELFIIIH